MRTDNWAAFNNGSVATAYSRAEREADERRKRQNQPFFFRRKNDNTTPTPDVPADYNK